MSSLRRRTRVLAAVALAAASLACAPMQRVPLDACVTEKVVVYVDGRLLESDPASLELRSDEPHKLYIKRPGEPPRLIVLDATPDRDGRLRLEPADPCSEVVAVGEGRELTIDVDEGAAGESQPAKP